MLAILIPLWHRASFMTAFFHFLPAAVWRVPRMLVVLALLWWAGSVRAQAVTEPDPVKSGEEDAVKLPPVSEIRPIHVPFLDDKLTKEQKLRRVNIVSTLGTVLYGFAFWDYGDPKYKFTDEGWFGENTRYGGADKTGHAYSSYVASEIFSALYESWGYSRPRASLYGAASGMSMFTLIEVGDGASRHGFSVGDLVMDATGVCLSYARRRMPALENLVDFRVEYFPSDAVLKEGQTDLATDYSGYKYLLALKLSGIPAFERNFLQYVEVHGGYYTRGYLNEDEDHDSDRERILYAGLALNLSRIFEQQGFRKTSTFLSYYQPPYTYLEAGEDLNK